MPKQPSPLRVGSRVKHSHFAGIARIDSFLNDGKVAVVVAKDGTHYVRVEELKREKD